LKLFLSGQFHKPQLYLLPQEGMLQEFITCNNILLLPVTPTLLSCHIRNFEGPTHAQFLLSSNCAVGNKNGAHYRTVHFSHHTCTKQDRQCT